MTDNLTPELPPPTDESADAPVVSKRKSNFFSFPVSPSTSLTEEYFGTLGPMSRANGWAVIPQERTEKRMPAKVDRKTIKWGLYHDVAPSIEETDRWAEQHFSTNVAAIMGAPSGYVWCLDIDVTDLDLAQEIEELAFRTMGRTIFRRIGSAPKRAIFYRAVGPEELPPSRSFHLLDERGEAPSGHLVEILAAKKMVTIYGRHHKTLKPFLYADRGQPGGKTIDEVPLVTLAQVEAFFSELQKVRSFKGSASLRSAAPVSGWHDEVEPTEHVSVPTIRNRESPAWSTVDGIVVDGREAFLSSIAYRVVTSSPGAALTAEGRDELRSVTAQLFRKHAQLDGKWLTRLESEVASKVGALVAKVHSGEIKGRLQKGTEIRADAPALDPSRVYGDDPERGTAWLDAVRSPVAQLKNLAFEGVVGATIPEHLRIAASPQAASEAVSKAVDQQIVRFLEAVRDRDPESSPLTRLVKAPTGAGKTIRLLDAIAATRTEEPSPILMLLPAYANIAELLVDAEARGLKAMTFEGKVRTGEQYSREQGGCARFEDVKKLQEAGKNSSGLCRALKRDGDPKVESDWVECPFYRDRTDPLTGAVTRQCRYQKQKAEIAECDIVFAVHQYLGVTIPRELSDGVRMVVVDESIRSQVVRSQKFSAEFLHHPRSLAFLSSKETVEGRTVDELISDREQLVAGVVPYLKRGEDPARWIAGDEGRKRMLASAIAICGRTRDALQIMPTSTPKLVEELCSIATQKEIRSEGKFWKLLRERVDFVEADRIPQALAEGTNIKPTKAAKGKTDRRLHYYRGIDGKLGELRLSWIADANFADKSMLLLDASANEVLLEKAIRRPIVSEPIVAPMRLRFVHVHGPSYSKTSLLPRPADRPEIALQRAQLLQEIRVQVSAIAAMYPGGVAACAPKAVRELILDGWASPANVSWMHYGATRGLNFASGYSAAVAIGCINPSAEQIDAEVAAYVYDENEQESLVDPVGENRRDDDDPEGWVYREVRIPMRNGAVLVTNQRGVEGRFAQAVYDQVRREEHGQFRGRLRPIHRSDVPDFYNIGSYIPEDVIVDEIVTCADLIAYGTPLEAVRRHQSAIGVPHEDALDVEVAAGEKLEKVIAAMPAVSRNLIHVKIASQLRYAPVYVADVIDRMVTDGEAEIIYSPDRTPIIRPAGWSEDVEIHQRRDAEHSTWKDFMAFGGYLGWTQDRDGDAELRHESDPSKRIPVYAVIEALKCEIPGLKAQVEEDMRREVEEHDWLCGDW